MSECKIERVIKNMCLGRCYAVFGAWKRWQGVFVSLHIGSQLSREVTRNWGMMRRTGGERKAWLALVMRMWK